MNHAYNQKGSAAPALIVGVIVIIILIGGFWALKSHPKAIANPSTTPTPSAPASISPSPTPTSTSTNTYKWGVFKGVTVCGDCSGIDTTLILYSTGPNVDTGTYSLTMVYQGKSVQPVVSQGDWTINRGTPDNPNATVVVLDEAGSGQQSPQYLLEVGSDKLQMLDADQKPLPSSLPSTLTRINAPNSNQVPK